MASPSRTQSAIQAAHFAAAAAQHAAMAASYAAQAAQCAANAAASEGADSDVAPATASPLPGYGTPPYPPVHPMTIPTLW